MKHKPIRTLVLYSLCLFSAFLLSAGFFVSAETIVGRPPLSSAPAGQQVFEGVVTLPDAAATPVSGLGIALWCLVFIALVAALCYMTVNIVKRRKVERERSAQALVKPQLIISEAYRKKTVRKK